MSEVDIFDPGQRREDLVDTYSVDEKTGKRTPDPPLSLVWDDAMSIDEPDTR